MVGLAVDLVWVKVTAWAAEMDQEVVQGESDPNLAVGMHAPGT